jgi:ribosome-associated protein
MDIKKLQRVVVDALEDVKAQNIKVFNTVGLSDMFDRVVLASGTSNRQTRALAYRVAQRVKESGGQVVSIEGADAGEWVLVDLGDLVVHVMQPAVREYYGLEEIWGGKPVHLKLAEPAARRVALHSAEAEAAAPAPPPAAHAHARPAAGTVATSKARVSGAAGPVRKRAGGATARTGANKAAPRRVTSGRAAAKPGRKAAAARKTAAPKQATRTRAGSATGAARKATRRTTVPRTAPRKRTRSAAKRR